MIRLHLIPPFLTHTTVPGCSSTIDLFFFLIARLGRVSSPNIIGRYKSLPHSIPDTSGISTVGSDKRTCMIARIAMNTKNISSPVYSFNKGFSLSGTLKHIVPSISVHDLVHPRSCGYPARSNAPIFSAARRDCGISTSSLFVILTIIFYLNLQGSFLDANRLMGYACRYMTLLRAGRQARR